MRLERGLHKMRGTHEEKFLAFIDHYRQHHFFGGELIPFWDVDIFEQTWHSPYTIYDDRLLIIRCEDLNEHGIKGICELLGLSSREYRQSFPHKNVVPTKREEIPLSEAYVNAMYRDKYFPRWFYSDDELKELKEKWMMQTQLP